MQAIRDHVRHVRGVLSVQASEYHYCTPRVNGAPIDHYTSVEVGLYPFRKGHDLGRPSDALGPIVRRLPFLPIVKEARALDRLFEEGNCPVAGYVSQADVQRLKRFLDW